MFSTTQAPLLAVIIALQLAVKAIFSIFKTRQRNLSSSKISPFGNSSPF